MEEKNVFKKVFELIGKLNKDYYFSLANLESKYQEDFFNLKFNYYNEAEQINDKSDDLTDHEISKEFLSLEEKWQREIRSLDDNYFVHFDQLRVNREEKKISIVSEIEKLRIKSRIKFDLFSIFY